MPWRAIGENIAYGLGSNRDTSAWFKNIVHRGLYLKAVGGQHEPCGACKGEQDNWLHLWRCPVFEPIWTNLVDLVNELLPKIQGRNQAEFSPECVYLGVLTNKHALPRRLALLHMITWKFIIHDLYNGGQSEHYVMDASKTNKRALRRYITRIHATLRELQLRILRDTPKGRTVDIKGTNTRLSPVARISEGGRDIQWEANMGRYLQAAGAIDPKPNEEGTITSGGDG